MTYTINSPDDIPYAEPTGYITNALTGVTTMYLDNGERIKLGVPLCTGCNQSVVDGACADCSEVEK